MLIPIHETTLSPEHLRALESYFQEDIVHVYYRNESPTQFPMYCYFEDFIWIHIFSLEMSMLETMRIKEMISQSKRRVQKHLQEKNYQALFSYTETIIKLDMFIKHFYNVPDTDKYDIFQSVYSKTEYHFSMLDHEFLRDVFSYRAFSSAWKEGMKRLEERFPNQSKIRVYRGEGSKSTPTEEALSWTLNKETAEFFATRFDDSGIIHEAWVQKEDVLDFLLGRGENEILVFPEHIIDVISYES